MEPDSLLELFEAGATLKRVPRSGWLLRGIAPVESVADHSYGVVLVALALCDILRSEGTPLDPGRVLSLAVLHDLAEARLTDLPGPAMRYLSREEKHRAEVAILHDLLAALPSAGELEELWQEYSAESTAEGRLVRDADRLDMMVQCLSYERAGSRGLEEFWEASDSATWHFPQAAILYAELKALRPSA